MAQARYKSLVDRFAEDIRSGRLAPGTRLPTHRQLAAREGLALVTASRVYAELAAMGLLSGETGRGTFVKDIALPRGLGLDLMAAAADVVDLNFNYPSLPGQADLLRSALRRLARGGDLEALLRYQPHGGHARERALVARHLARRGLTVEGAQLSLVDGAQHGLSTSLMALLKPGDVVAVDALSYPGFKLIAETLHLELLPLPAAQDGPDLEVLARLCKRRKVRAIYTMPTLHNPMGWVMSLQHRQGLVELARRYGLIILEDGAYAYLVDKAPPPLAALAPELTVYISGFSKNLAAGLRVGYVLAPLPWVPKIERAIRATTWATPGVMTALTCAWLEDGTVDRLEAEKRQDAKLRQRLAAKILGNWPRIAHPNSYFVWLPLAELTEDMRADQIAAELLAAQVSVSTAQPFATTPQVPHAIRLALGSVDLPTLQQGLLRVDQALQAHRFL